MANVQSDITIVLPREQFKGSVDRTLSIPIELGGDRKQLIESDRSKNVSALEESEKERAASNIYRIGGKITQIFANTLFGSTEYNGFKNYLYLFNPVNTLENNDILFNNNGERVVDTFNLKWSGFPQYSEFNFIRTDADNPHLDYKPQSASTYNWGCYLSYVFSSDTNQRMSYVDRQISGNTLDFVVSDGIPFTIINTVDNGKNYITFRCGGKHNLTPFQFVELSLTYNGTNIFQVSSIGEAGFSNEDTTFSILNPGYTGNTFTTGTVGTLKRISDISNISESRSEYYVRLHKILTDENGVVINKMGFENTPFVNKQQVEYSALTPNLQERVSTLDGTQSYSFTVVNDFNLEGFKTTHNRPLTDVYLTIINKGYAGWFNKPNPDTNTSIQYGWDFNYQTDIVDEWWSTNNIDSFSNISVGQYNKVDNGITYVFYYNNPLKVDDILVGDFCEFNKLEQIELVVSECNHKLTFNDSLYSIDSFNNAIPEGYFYKPFHQIKLRVFSESVSTDINVSGLNRPTWAYYSVNRGVWLWREILLPGVLELGDNGVNYPFLNGAHYPFKQTLFLLSTPFKNINQSVINTDAPMMDDCE